MVRHEPEPSYRTRDIVEYKEPILPHESQQNAELLDSEVEMIDSDKVSNQLANLKFMSIRNYRDI